MFDVPPPSGGGAGHRCLSRHVAALFHMAKQGVFFEIDTLDITAGQNVPFAYALLRCGTAEELKRDLGNRLA